MAKASRKVLVTGVADIDRKLLTFPFVVQKKMGRFVSRKIMKEVVLPAVKANAPEDTGAPHE